LVWQVIGINSMLLNLPGSRGHKAMFAYARFSRSSARTLIASSSSISASTIKTMRKNARLSPMRKSLAS
jgi:hypothetical protein